MRRLLLLCVALIAASVSTGHAAGINLGWDDCGGLGSTPFNKFGTPTFSCNTNASTAGLTSSIVGSYVLASDISNFVTLEAVLDMKASFGAYGGELAPWWDFGNYPAVATPGCRNGELLFSFRNAATSCLDWPGPAPVQGNMIFERGFGAPNRARIKLIGAYTSGTPQPVLAGDEMVAFTLTINNAKTAGTGSCAGCTTPMCLVLVMLVVGQSPAANPPLSLDTPDVVDFVTWNDASNTSHCPGAVPTVRSTWGQVKSLYRE
jgi:hypothetical protein